jgi:hypothetical protein
MPALEVDSLTKRFVDSTCGQWTSIWAPRPVSMDSLQNQALAFLLTLGAHLALLPLAATFLERRREVLVERLG